MDERICELVAEALGISPAEVQVHRFRGPDGTPRVHIEVSSLLALARQDELPGLLTEAINQALREAT